MRKFRKIVVDQVEYKWLFRYDDHNYSNCPYLLIAEKSSSEKTWCIHFPTAEHFLYNIGFPAKFRGEKVVINLNRPFYVSQIIKYCRNREEKIPQAQTCYTRKQGKNRTGIKRRYKYLDGIEILRQSGYDINRRFTYKMDGNMGTG